MSTSLSRKLAALVGDVLSQIYPKGQSGWARAMRHEIEQVEGDRAALAFALGCFWGGCREAAADQFRVLKQGVTMMMDHTSLLKRPRTVGIACAFAATCLGIFYMIAAGAPARYIIVNAAAFLLGVVALRGLAQGVQTRRFTSIVMIASGLSLIATAMFGASVDGASRWTWFGPLSVQVSLVVLPLMIMAFARKRYAVGTLAMVLAAVGLALQPDRAMAGVLALGMALLTVMKPERWTAAALAVAVIGFGASVAQPDALPPVPYVDRILFTAFDLHPLAGAAVLLGSLLLLVPAIVGWRGNSDEAHIHLVFGAVWLGCIVAAALGNYPTPVVGYGGSAILGYLLSLSSFPAGVGAVAGETAGKVGDSARHHPELSKSAVPV